jgi:hypothetical protein
MMVRLIQNQRRQAALFRNLLLSIAERFDDVAFFAGAGGPFAALHN